MPTPPTALYRALRPPAQPIPPALPQARLHPPPAAALTRAPRRRERARRAYARLAAAGAGAAQAQGGEAGEAAVALQPGRGPDGGRHGDGAGDDERELGTALRREPAGQDAGGRPGAVEREVVEAGDAAAEVVG